MGYLKDTLRKQAAEYPNGRDVAINASQKRYDEANHGWWGEEGGAREMHRRNEPVQDEEGPEAKPGEKLKKAVAVPTPLVTDGKRDTGKGVGQNAGEVL